jgi:PucR family transcriptional regulator, purine catabolism regulatory protein
MLTVRDIAALPDLGLGVAAGAGGLGAEVSWLHVSELEDPTQFLEGGEFLLTTGLGVGELASAQRGYVRRLAGHGLAGLGFGLGLGFAEVPRAILDEANKLDFAVLTVPYEVPFIAITKAALARLASERLEQVDRAREVNERLAEAVLEGRGVQALLAIVCSHLGCSLALVDEHGRTIGERHADGKRSFDGALELAVVAHEERATLRAARTGRPFGDYDRLVLHHGQSALAFELARRWAVSAAELRLAGDLLEDLEEDRLDERETARRMTAFGLQPERSYAALLAAPQNGSTGETVRREVAEQLERRPARYVSTVRRDRAAFLVEVANEEDVLAIARTIADGDVGARVSIGRPARGRGLGRSLVEARAALDAVGTRVASYRDLGALELLLSLPDAALRAFVDRMLGAAADRPVLIESLGALLDSGCRWSDAAQTLGVHRHTLRYRMDKLRELAGRHPDDPAERMELWLALKASQALAARNAGAKA